MHELAHVLSVLISVEVLLIVVRVITSWIPDIDPWHPLMRGLRAVVDPVLRPFRALLPTFAGIDLSPLLAIITLQAVGGVFSDFANGFIPSALLLVLFIVRDLVLAIFALLAVVVFIRLVISLFKPNPWHPFVVAIRDMSRPLVAPFGAVLPRTRSVDTAALTALVVILVGYFASRYVLDQIIIHSY